MTPSEHLRRLMEMERRLSKIELKVVAITAQNDKIIASLTALGVGGLTFSTSVKN